MSGYVLKRVLEFIWQGTQVLFICRHFQRKFDRTREIFKEIKKEILIKVYCVIVEININQYVLQTRSYDDYVVNLHL